MKVLTIKSIEKLSADQQTDIHYAFRMEHHTDYIFKDEGASEYSATISMPDTTDVINLIIKNSTDYPELTFMLDDLDMEKNSIQRLRIKNGNTLEKKSADLKWKE